VGRRDGKFILTIVRTYSTAYLRFDYYSGVTQPPYPRDATSLAVSCDAPSSQVSAPPSNDIIILPKLDFQAVILAGGLGTRMRPTTETIPKPMIPVCGRPFLHHQLELLRRNGFGRVLLLVAYRGEQIEQHFGDGTSLGIDLNYSYEPAPLGTGGAVKNAQDRLEKIFLLLNGDTFLAVDYSALLADFHKHTPTAMIVAYEGQRPDIANNLAVALDGCVTSYQKRHAEGMTHVDAGAIVLDRRALQDIPPGRTCSLEEEVFPRLIEQRHMRAWITREPFFDMGSAEGLKTLAERLG
jgi:mannose-1-phosphate guanylyltransferase